MKNNFPYIQRDISWLSFNYRVLQEAKDQNVPLFERIKFLAIYSNNLDEFFRVRVANHRNLLRIGKKTQKQLEDEPGEILKQIQTIVNAQQVEFSEIFENQIIPELKKNGIYLKRRGDLTIEQREFIEVFFQDNLLPFVQPVLLLKGKIRPFLNNAALYLAIHLRDKANHRANKYALLKIPSDHIPRFIELPSPGEHHELIILDDIVRHSAEWIFPGYDIVDEYSIKLTRDAELYIDDEYSGDLIAKIKRSLRKRNVGPASRLVYDKEIPKRLLSYLQDTLNIHELDLLPEGRYHNNFDFFQLPDFGLKHLSNIPLPALPYPPIAEAKSVLDEIKSQDHLVHVPYHSYESVIRFFEEAATDPRVTHIKIVQYRVARVSRIMNALLQAIKAGKQVFVFIEVKARFDEEANLKWGETLEEAGVTVRYSYPGLKVHSKMALIRRIEDRKAVFYSYMSTGNFHEGTAKLYSDFGLFTHDKRITNEVARLFTYLESDEISDAPFQHLLVGQFNLRSTLEQLIRKEIREAKRGKECGITLKMNSLQDHSMINLLYEASQAGVPIQLNVRGICSLVSGIKGVSDQIESFSIVDRYLEHSRIFVFHNQGDPKIYLSSADWMVRNLSHRIETIFPIYQEDLKIQILDYLNIQAQDNVKGRSLSKQNHNKLRKKVSDMPIRSQHEVYFYLKRWNEAHYQKQREDLRLRSDDIKS